MKVTHSLLKKIIREEIEKIKEQSEEAVEPQGQPPSQSEATPAKEPDREAVADLQGFRKELINVARSLTGINAQELPFIKVALSIIQKAKEGNVNVGILKTHLAMVQKDLQQVK